MRTLKKQHHPFTQSCQYKLPNFDSIFFILKKLLEAILLFLIANAILMGIFLALGLNPVEIYETAFENAQAQPSILLPLLLVAISASAIGLMLGYIFMREYRTRKRT
jgi:ABC-type polysaccharide/polyol phosphate export permease